MLLNAGLAQQKQEHQFICLENVLYTFDLIYINWGGGENYLLTLFYSMLLVCNLLF